jgi:ATP phosphoribosyltransferase regulatory subunit
VSALPNAAAPRPLRVAVPKGLAEPGRHLIIRNPDVEYIIARPTDVPVYIAYGGADCAIAGKDVLVEAGLDSVELVDLDFGGCRFIVAEPEDAGAQVHERLKHLGVVRVASKYPNITQSYFDSIGVQVEIVKLHGNIELAPLIGLADQIVDITATGTTLRENRLKIVAEVLESTARFVGNPAAVRTDPRVLQLADALANNTR